MIKIDIRQADKVNGEMALYVSFPYNTEIVSVLRELPSRYWHKDVKQWEVPIKKFSTLLDSLSAYEFDITGLENVSRETSKKIKLDYAFKTQPFQHQIEGVEYGLNHDCWLLGDEQGLGKTKQVIDIAMARKSEGKHCLIVCGVNGLKWNWVNEIQTHSDETGYILGQRVQRGKIVIGGNKDKLEDVKRLKDISSYFIITNVESLRDNMIADALAKLCTSGDIEMVAIDEIHKCKNPSSQQGKGILKLQPKYRIAMTGTPLMNQPLDLYIILRWLGYERHAFYAFKKHICIMGGYGGYEVIGYKNLDELQEQLNEIMLRRLKEDVLDLPEKLYVNEYIEMTPKQEQIYNEVSAEIRANIDQIKASNNPLAELLRMRQATGYTGILSSKIKESAKLDRMEEIVEEATSNGKKVVIFSNWTQMTTPIRERLKQYKPAVITGEIKDNERQEMVRRFQEDADCKVIIGTTGAMGTGITLTAGTVEIFMDEPWNKANKEQAEDRCHRVGTSENVTVYTLMCKNTIDEKVHDIVERKGAMSDAIVDGKIVISKSEMIDFLLG